MIRFGPSGNSTEFYEQGYKHTYQEGQFLDKLGLSAFEYSFGRGVSMSDETAAKIKTEMDKYDISISSHAPYYTNFANDSEEMIGNCFRYIHQSLVANNNMGGKRVVFHPATCGKAARDVAYNTAKTNIARCVEQMRSSLDFEFVLCPETMGKNQQIGRVEEIVDICTLDDCLIPCFDFGHVNCIMQGGLNSSDEYKKIIDYCADKLGDYKTRNMHIHFSKIEFSKGGEVRHLTFEDEIYGPEFEHLDKVLTEYKLTPTIICESRDVMSIDALKMLRIHTKNS